MKNLYPKGKGGRIHPSHHPDDAMAALALLPAAVLAIAAAMGPDDREVLAYLVARSMKGPWAVPEKVGEEDRRRCRSSSYSAGRAHRPAFDCGCFDCYTSFWLRWDSSPDREVIHRAIEEFEEHLASSEKKEEAAAGKRRDRRGGEKKGRGKKAADRGVEDVGVEMSGAVEVGGGRAAASPAEDAAVEVDVEEVGGGGGDRRKGWTDVMGMLNSRLWSFWTPAA